MGFSKIKGVAIGLLLLLTPWLTYGCPAPAKKPEANPGKPNQVKVMTEEPTITLFVKETGQKKRIKMEEYIKGVVAAEMDPAWPVEALAAQAIIARTYTLKQMKTKGGVPKRKADASTDIEEFQAYDATRINDNVTRAVERTRGEIVRYKGDYIQSWFSACCGGESALAKEGLAFNKEATPYLSNVRDGCITVTVPENKSWTKTFPVSKVQQVVKEKTGRDPGPVTTAKIIKWGPSGRAETVKINNIAMSGPALRLGLGSDQMRSTFIDKLAVSGGKLTVHGKGFGHGVGLCQWGAKKFSKEGKSPEEIVKFYFKDVTIDKIWK